MIAPPYEMNVLQVIPPAFPYNLMEISKIHFSSHLDYAALRAFLEDGFNKASLDHAPNIDSLFGYECTGIRNFHMFTCDVTIFSECLYEKGKYTILTKDYLALKNQYDLLHNEIQELKKPKEKKKNKKEELVTVE